MEYPTSHLYRCILDGPINTVNAVYDGEVWWNTNEYKLTFLHCDWPYFLWHGIKVGTSYILLGGKSNCMAFHGSQGKSSWTTCTTLPHRHFLDRMQLKVVVLMLLWKWWQVPICQKIFNLLQ